MIIGGIGFSPIQATYLTGISVGTAAVSKALVLDASRNIANINSLGTGILLLGGVPLTGSSGSLINGVSNGSVAAGKVVVPDGNLDVSGFRSMYFNNPTAYTPLTLSQGSGVSVALQSNSAGYSYWGPSTAHGFALQTSNSGALFISSAGNISIGGTNNNTYKLNVQGALNCSQLYIGDTFFNPSSSTLSSVLVDEIALNQSSPSSTKWFAFDNSGSTQNLILFQTGSGITSDSLGSIVVRSASSSFAIQNMFDRSLSSSNHNGLDQAWCSDPRSGVSGFSGFAYSLVYLIGGDIS